MAKIILCCLLLVVCYSTYVNAKPAKPRVIQNSKDTGCTCKTFSCSCCAGLVVPQVGLNNSICLGFGYEPDVYGISLIISVDDKAVINETISATNPPPLCTRVPFIKEFLDGCIHFSDLAISNKKFHGCAQLELRMWLVYVVAEYKLGCFDLKNIDKQHAQVLKLFSKSKSLNITEKPTSTSVQLKNIQ